VGGGGIRATLELASLLEFSLVPRLWPAPGPGIATINGNLGAKMKIAVDIPFRFSGFLWSVFQWASFKIQKLLRPNHQEVPPSIGFLD